MPPELLALLADQSGVVARTQILARGMADHDIWRLLRGRRLVRIHRGVYLDHTGEPTWEQRCWAAVLALAPAALAGETALRAAEGPESQRRDHLLTVAIPWEARRRSLAGVRVVRTRAFTAQLHPGSGLPRVRYEQALLDVLDAVEDQMALVSHVTLAVSSRRTNAVRIRRALAARSRFSGRRGLEALLLDVEAGTCSVLEHGYVTRVERPHGLPRTSRQVSAMVRGGVIYRDALSETGVCIELQLATIHRRRGWRGWAYACGPDCVAG